MHLSLPRPSPRLAITGLVLLIVLAVGFAALVARDALAAAREVQSAQQDLHGVLSGGDLSHVSRGQIQRARTKLDDAARRLSRDRRLLSPAFPIMRAARWLPYIGLPAGEAPDLFELAQRVAEGGAAIAKGVDPLLAQTEDVGPLIAPSGATSPVASAGADGSGAGAEAPSPGARLVQALDSGAPDLARGDTTLHKAQALRAHLHPDDYHWPLGAIRNQVALLDRQLSSVLNESDGLALMPAATRTLLGFAGPRTYVVLGEDSAELRPTGGFVGSAGLVTLDQGKLTFQEYRSSYDFDGFNVPPLPPPAPLQRYLGAAAWYLRDANWSPDFPASAEQVLDFVTRDTGIVADGVIAFDSYAVTDLLKALGPIQVEGFSELVTSENWLDLTTRAIFTGSGSLEGQLGDYNQAKGVGLSAVLRAVLSKVQSVHGSGLLSMVDELRRAAAGSHVLLALNDQQPATWARLVGADGALFPPPDGDVVAPVEANVSYSKVGPYIERMYRYDVWLDANGRPQQAQLAAAYRNTVTDALLSDPTKRIEGARWIPSEAAFAPAPGLYGDYLRIYVPGSSTLQVATGLDGPLANTTEKGYRVLGALVALTPQSERTVTYGYVPDYYALPRGDYRLALIKQPGIEKLRVNVNIHLATGTTVLAMPEGARRDGDAVSLELDVTGVTRIAIHVVRQSGR